MTKGERSKDLLFALDHKSIFHLSKQKFYKITNADRQKMLAAFFDNITETTDNSTRNDLYRTIIESIVRHKNGDDIKVIVNLK